MDKVSGEVIKQMEALHEQAKAEGRIAPKEDEVKPIDLTEHGFGLRHKDCTFENFRWENMSFKMSTFVSPEGKGLYLWGKPGTGKTHLLAAIAKELLKKNIGVSRIHILDLLRDIRSCYDNRGQSEIEVVDKWCGYEHLMIDDIGTEKPTAWVIEILNLIINRRYEDMSITSYTANLSLDELADKLGDRITSRIAETCKTISFEGIPDYRVKEVSKEEGGA